MATSSHCLICHSAIAHPGAECPHCRSRTSAVNAPPVLALTAVFAAMLILFAATQALTSFFRESRDARKQVHLRAAAAAAAAFSYDEAIEEYRNALSYGREDSAARLGLAQALFSLGRLPEAEKHLIDLRAADPTDAVVNQLLARIASGLGRPDEAISYYRTAIRGRWLEDPRAHRLQARFELVALLESQGDQLQVVNELVELLKEVPDDLAVRKRIARLLLAAGAHTEAVAVFQEIVRSDPEDASAYQGLGEAEFGRSHYLSARTAFAQSLSIDAGAEAAWRWLRLCNRVVDLDPTYRRAGTRERQRRSREVLERAIGELQRCLEVGARGAVGESPPPADKLGSVVHHARGLLDREVPPAESEEAVEENISMAELLWQSRLAACPARAPWDEPLRYVIEKLSQ